jgi:hypothetical protein
VLLFVWQPSLLLPKIEIAVCNPQSTSVHLLMAGWAKRDHVLVVMGLVDSPLANVVKLDQRDGAAWICALATGFRH